MGCAVGLPQNIGVLSHKSFDLSKKDLNEFFSLVNCNNKMKKDVNVVASISDYPKTAHKGQRVNFRFVITNNGTKLIYDVRIDAQEIYKKL